MNRELLSKAVGEIDEAFVAEAYRPVPEAASGSSERIVPMKKKRIITFALAAALLLALGIVAYAANLFGLRELYANPNRGDMPEEAANLIVSQSAEVEGDGWSASVLETYCDEGTVLVAVRVSADASYIVVPTDADLDSPLSVIGLSGEGTLREYAQKEGKTLLFVGANLDWEALGLNSAGERFENASPQEMTIYVEGARNSDTGAPVDTVCTVVAVSWSPDTQDPDTVVTERRELPITLTEGKSTLLGRFVPADPHALPGFELGELSLAQTPLGIELRLEIKTLDEEAARNLLTLRLDGVEFHGAGTIDPNGYAVFSQGQGDFGDIPVIRFLDWDKNTIAEVTFEKIG
jgi:hypothetical protein